MRPPFIIIGMHRSGTTLLAKVLERSGIFMGVMKDPNFEAYHFLSLNQQSLAAAGGSWINPVRPRADISESADVLYREHFKLNGRLAIWSNRLQNPAWGWKDPRNTFTLKLWLKLFPQAKVIHLKREQKAVVKSLQLRNRVPGEVHESALEDAQFCAQLHQKYLEEAQSWQKPLGDRYLELDYAALLEPQSEGVQALSKFCGRPLQQALKEYLR